MTAAILDGVVLGLQFGLLGVGLTVVYGLGGILNLAHGQLAVIGAVTTATVMGRGLPAGPAAVVGVLTAGVVGLILELTLLRPVYRQLSDHRVLMGFLLTLGASFVLSGLMVWRFPIEALTLHVGGGAVDVLGVRMRRGSLLAAGVALAAAAALLIFLRASTAGRAVRSVIQDEEGAKLVGISPARVRTSIFTLSAMLAGLIAVTRSMTSPVSVTSGVDLTVFALIVSVVGGLGSVAGAFLAGILLGIVNTVSSFYIGQYVTSIVLLTAAAMTIVFRPAGLLGRQA